ncbi:MAG: DUF4199 domain-containing protein [Saprospiraceae bacterium]|nr:DUF4199 domain-containing protein [Saprospiraceae bacterium]
MNANILKYGLYAGAGTIAYLLLFYFIDPRLMLSPWVSWSSLLIYIAAMLKATMVERDASGGAFLFREALRPAFGAYVVASVVYVVFNYVLYNFVDTHLVEIQREMMVEQSKVLAEKMGREDLMEQMENISVEDLRVGFRNSAVGFMWSLIGGFFLSAIIALFIKREA